jgi:hypothetical protein
MAYTGVTMKIVEYKRHLTSGVIVDPEFIMSGGVFFSPGDNTWVGKVLDVAQRTYYIPDTLQELSRDELVARQLALQSTYPLTRKSDPNNPESESVPLTSDEVIAVVDAWIAGA